MKNVLKAVPLCGNLRNRSDHARQINIYRDKYRSVPKIPALNAATLSNLVSPLDNLD